MKVKKCLALILSTVIISNSVMPAFATESSSEIHVEEQECIVDVEFPESDILFAGYAGQVFYNTEDRTTFSVGNHSAGAKLSGDEKLAYDALIPIIKDIASGDRASAVISVGESFSYAGVDYNVDSKVSFKEATSEFDVDAVIEALLLDYPYEMYWYDKTIESQIQIWSSGERVLQIILNLYVSGNYQDGNNTTVDVNNAVLTKSAAEYAKSLVKNNEDKSDYEKLLAYKDAICNLVTYDNNAADVGDFTIDNDPWQLIYVFDRNDSTNVVCEGYTKAFQYLCDMTSFETDVSCYSVTGVMSSSTGGGAHMWNIVTLDGQNYLVDVTNCDSGTIGYPDELFLCGTGSGNVTNGYTISMEDDNVLFVYDEAMVSFWGEEVLTLSDSDYTPTDDSVEKATPTVQFEVITETLTYTGEKAVITAPVVKINGEKVENAEITYSYRLSGSEENYISGLPTEVGTYEVLATLAEGDNYKGTISNILTLVIEQVTSIEPEIIASGTCDNGKVSWSLNEEGLLEISGEGIVENCFDEISLSIKRIIAHVGITSIGENAFTNCSELKSIELPKGLKNIEYNAFSGCSKLTNVELPEGVMSIGDFAFYECSELANIELPKGLISIGDAAFNGCSKLISIEIPEGVTSIGTSVFGGCTELKNIELPEGIKRIERNTFLLCSNLTSIELPEGVTSIGEYAFAYCSKLESIELPKGLKNIEDNAFSRCTKLTSVELPEEVTSIGKFAFFSCSELQSIEFPKGLTSIGDSAFNKCSELKSLEIPEGVMSIGEYAFAHCSGLNSVKLPKGLKNIEGNTFSGCSKLTDVELPEGIINIGEYAFAYCSELKSIRIPISVIYIGKKAFDDHIIIKCNCNSYAYEWAVANGVVVTEVTHEEIEKIEKIEAKCETIGNYEYYICRKCKKMYQDENCITELTDAEIVIPALGHKEVVDKAVAPTSTKPGLTEGSHCSVCNEVLKGQMVVEALGNNNPFNDVQEGRFFYDPVLWAVKNNITTGTSPVTFSPDDPCTRAQVVTFIWRAINRPEASSKSTFVDLREGAYYLDAVDWAVANGITTGTSPNTFSPDEACTRAQIVTFLWRVAGCPKPSKESAFEDLREGAYYLDAVRWAVEEGITIGTSPTKFSPDEKCSRAQVVTFLYRYIY